jgi:hypothetical protein
MSEPGDNINSLGSGTHFESEETPAMAMVAATLNEQSVMAQVQGTTEGTKNVVIGLEETENENVQRKEMPSRSEMWQHFIKIKDEKGIIMAGRCKYCHRDIKANTRGHGTSALKKHFATCKRNPHVFNKDLKQAILQASHGEAPVTWRFDQATLRVAFAEMVIEDEQPFCFGEKPGLRKFLSKACPRFEPPSRRTCTRDIVRLYFEEKVKLKKFFNDSC